MSISQLNAVKREKAGKGASRAKRREGSFLPLFTEIKKNR